MNYNRLDPDDAIPRCANCYQAFDLANIPEEDEIGQLICEKCRKENDYDN